jgi:hypothetical protein
MSIKRALERIVPSRIAVHPSLFLFLQEILIGFSPLSHSLSLSYSTYNKQSCARPTSFYFQPSTGSTSSSLHATSHNTKTSQRHHSNNDKLSPIMTRSTTATVALALMATLPSVLGHMSIWGDYVYGAEAGDIFNPLGGMSYEEWVSRRVRERD